MRATSPLPAGLVPFRALRALLAVADGTKLVSRDSKLQQKLLGGARPLIAETEVVLGRAALVAMALHDDRGVREISQNRPDSSGVAGQYVACVGADIALVVIEVRVLHVRHQPLFHGRPGRRGG